MTRRDAIKATLAIVASIVPIRALAAPRIACDETHIQNDRELVEALYRCARNRKCVECEFVRGVGDEDGVALWFVNVLSKTGVNIPMPVMFIKGELAEDQLKPVEDLGERCPAGHVFYRMKPDHD